MKKLIFLLTCLVLFLSSCNSRQEIENYYTFKDSTGEEIHLKEKPTRVAVLFSSYAEIWNLAGGKTEITVYESVERGFANKNALLVDAGAGKSINTELLISYKPDFVIGSLDIPAQVNTAKTLKSAGIPCALFKVENFYDYLDVLKIFSDITENEKAYQMYGISIQKKIDSLIKSVPKAEQKSVLFIRASSGAGATKAKTADNHFAALMLKELGTYNIAEGAPVLLDGLSIEAIIKANPDYIFISTMGNYEQAKAYISGLFEEAGWRELNAIKSGRYYFLEKELFQYKPNGKWYEAYLKLWKILYE